MPTPRLPRLHPANLFRKRGPVTPPRAPVFPEPSRAIREAQGHLVEGARRDDLSLVDLALRQGADPAFNDSEALYWAAENRAHGALQKLLPLSRPKARCSRALQAAVRQGDEVGMALLLPVSDANLVMRETLKEAEASDGPTVDRLLVHVSARWQNRAMAWARTKRVRLVCESQVLLGRSLETSLPSVQASTRPRL